MGPLQELPISAAPASAGAGCAEGRGDTALDRAGGPTGGSRAGARGAGARAGRAPGAGVVPTRGRRTRCVIGVIGGALWWGGLIWLVLGPEASTASVPGWIAAGGWGLGLIPLHAVPAHVRRPRVRPAQGADLAV